MKATSNDVEGRLMSTSSVWGRGDKRMSHHAPENFSHAQCLVMPHAHHPLRHMIHDCVGKQNSRKLRVFDRKLDGNHSLFIVTLGNINEINANYFNYKHSNVYNMNQETNMVEDMHLGHIQLLS